MTTSPPPGDRARLRIDDEALARIVAHLMGVFGDEEAGEGVANRGLLGARELAPGGARGQPRHGPNVEGGGDRGRETAVAFAHAELAGRSERRHQLAVIGLDTAGGLRLSRRRDRAQREKGEHGRDEGRRQAQAKCEAFHLRGIPFARREDLSASRRTLFEGLAGARPRTGFYRHFGNRVETWSSEARGLDDGINFFNGLPLVSQRGRGGAPAARPGHVIESLLEWRSSPQNNRKWTA